MLTDAGLNHIADQMSVQIDTAMSHMAVGTGVTAPAAGDTALETESARAALTSKSRTGAKVIYVGTFGAGVATGPLTEAAVLNAAVAGIMLARHTFAVKNKEFNDTLVVNIETIYQRV